MKKLFTDEEIGSILARFAIGLAIAGIAGVVGFIIYIITLK